ncbi:hypothetical protein AO1008_02866 [Aspergillus oryzae 100-8]|nr:hypothetical protein AO1008_02866 [Aspergillus oryzae 100-8]
MGRVLSIENQLLSWVMALPNNLRQLSLQDLREEVGQSDSQPRLFPLKFRVILTLRYLHIQILLHRPILVKFLDASHASGLEPGEERVLNEIGYSSMKKCVESAMGIIDMIHELVCATGWQRDLLGAWWYSLYYSKLPSLAFLWICEYLITLSPGIAFNAALVIIGATWVQRTRQSVRDFPSHQLANIELYPGRAVATLRQLDMGNRMVDRCRYYLEQLISILHLEPENSTDTAPIDLGLAAMGSSTTDGSGIGTLVGCAIIDHTSVLFISREGRLWNISSLSRWRQGLRAWYRLLLGDLLFPFSRAHTPITTALPLSLAEWSMSCSLRRASNKLPIVSKGSQLSNCCAVFRCRDC